MNTTVTRIDASETGLPKRPPDHALCIGCNYALRGLHERRCPECGRPFDPADASTMNLGRPMPRLARRLMGPYGASEFAIAGAAGLALVGLGAFPSFYYMRGYALTCLWIVLVLLYLLAREFVRSLVARVFCQPHVSGVGRWAKRTTACLAVVLLLVVTKLPMRAGFWAWRAQFEQLAADARGGANVAAPGTVRITLPAKRRIGWFVVSPAVRAIERGGFLFHLENDDEAGFGWTAGGGLGGEYNAGADGPLGGDWYWFAED